MKIEHFDVLLSKQSEKPYTGGEAVQVRFQRPQQKYSHLIFLLVVASPRILLLPIVYFIFL